MTSRMKTLVEVFAIEATSKEASSADTAMYLATEPKPGHTSVSGKSLSTVLGRWIACTGKPMVSDNCDTLKQVSAESPPPL